MNRKTLHGARDIIKESGFSPEQIPVDSKPNFNRIKTELDLLPPHVRKIHASALTACLWLSRLSLPGERLLLFQIFTSTSRDHFLTYFVLILFNILMKDYSQYIAWGELSWNSLYWRGMKTVASDRKNIFS